jgi:hypothetical protein
MEENKKTMQQINQILRNKLAYTGKSLQSLGSLLKSKSSLSTKKLTLPILKQVDDRKSPYGMLKKSK